MATVLSAALEPLMARVSSDKSHELPPLRPTKPFDPSLTAHIDAFVQSNQCNPAARAALHLLNDDIDLAHSIAQDDEGDMTSNLCHAVLHRREGDYWNSKWWYRQIRHPLIAQVYGSTAEAQSFVDAIEAMVTNKRQTSTACAAGDVDRLKLRQAQELAALVRFALGDQSDKGRGTPIGGG